uniref:Uncharacterized protein n=1 Tax=Anguilla anguilla TaxID=7936 RepID=A0A0E9XN72_ANGAN
MFVYGRGGTAHFRKHSYNTHVRRYIVLAVIKEVQLGRCRI